MVCSCGDPQKNHYSLHVAGGSVFQEHHLIRRILYHSTDRITGKQLRHAQALVKTWLYVQGFSLNSWLGGHKRNVVYYVSARWNDPVAKLGSEMEQPQSIHRIYETNLWISSWAQEIAFFWGLDWCSLTMQNYALLQEKNSKAEALESQVALCGQLKEMKKDNKLLLKNSTLLFNPEEGRTCTCKGHGADDSSMLLKIQATFLKFVNWKAELPASAHYHPVCGVCYMANQADTNYKNTQKANGISRKWSGQRR